MTYDRNPLRVPTDPNDTHYSGTFIAVQYSMGHPPTWISAHLRRQVKVGMITWRFAMIAQAKYQLLDRRA